MCVCIKFVSSYQNAARWPTKIEGIYIYVGSVGCWS